MGTEINLSFFDHVFIHICALTSGTGKKPKDLGRFDTSYFCLAHLMAFMEVCHKKHPVREKTKVYKKFLRLLEKAQVSEYGKESLLLLKNIIEESRDLLLEDTKAANQKTYSELDLLMIIIHTWADSINAVFTEMSDGLRDLSDSLKFAGIRVLTLQIIFDILETHYFQELKLQIPHNELEELLSYTYLTVHTVSYNASQVGLDHPYHILEDQLHNLLLEEFGIQIPDTEDPKHFDNYLLMDKAKLN